MTGTASLDAEEISRRISAAMDGLLGIRLLVVGKNLSVYCDVMDRMRRLRGTSSFVENLGWRARNPASPPHPAAVENIALAFGRPPP